MPVVQDTVGATAEAIHKLTVQKIDYNANNSVVGIEDQIYLFASPTDGGTNAQFKATLNRASSKDPSCLQAILVNYLRK